MSDKKNHIRPSDKENWDAESLSPGRRRREGGWLNVNETHKQEDTGLSGQLSSWDYTVAEKGKEGAERRGDRHRG